MRKREGTKEKDILDAAIKIFAQYGYHKAKIASIAEVAGVATGSIYLYYKNKESILLSIFDNFWNELTGQLQAIIKRSDLDPLEKLDLLVDKFFAMFIANPALASVYVHEQQQLITEKRGNIAGHYERYLDLAEEIVREGMKKKVFDGDVDIKLYRYYITGGIRNVLYFWSLNSQAYPLTTIQHNVKFFIKHSLI